MARQNNTNTFVRVHMRERDKQKLLPDNDRVLDRQQALVDADLAKRRAAIAPILRENDSSLAYVEANAPAPAETAKRKPRAKPAAAKKRTPKKTAAKKAIAKKPAAPKTATAKPRVRKAAVKKSVPPIGSQSGDTASILSAPRTSFIDNDSGPPWMAEVNGGILAPLPRYASLQIYQPPGFMRAIGNWLRRFGAGKNGRRRSNAASSEPVKIKLKPRQMVSELNRLSAENRILRARLNEFTKK
jgi:hypothetical protein